MENKYLPLGSVVLLKDGDKSIMIYGRRQIMTSSNTLYDYIACLYPEGNLDPNKAYLFNHDSIREILSLGFSNDEDKEFVKILLETDES